MSYENKTRKNIKEVIILKVISKRLPDSEFDIMNYIWDSKPPVTTLMALEQVGKEREWKLQTVVSLFARLTERGFLRIENTGTKTRAFYPIISREEYLQFETGNFMNHYKIKSPVSLISSLYNGKSLTETDLDDLEEWIKKTRKRGEE